MKFWLTLTLGKSYTSCNNNFTKIVSRCSIALVAPFAGLRRFADGRGFKQWTGDDSKALMKVGTVLLPHAAPVLIKY
jgi:hypothetical protein